MADGDRGDVPVDPDDAPGGLSILRASTGHYATKQYSLGRNGKLRKDGYGNEKWFSVTTAKVNGIDELAARLDRLQHDPHAFVVRGALLPEANPQLTRRLLHPDPKDGYPAAFRSADRQWLAIDFDGIPTPVTIDPVADPEGAIEYLIGLLPPEFQDATCWWQWTSSQGFKPDTLNARIWFWLDRTIADADLTRWAKAINKAAGRTLIDDALFRAVQPHYVTAPIIRGMPDPVPRRSGLRKGLDDAVSLVLPEKTAATTGSERSGEGIAFRETVGFEAYLGRIGGEDGFNRAIYKAIWSYVGSNGADAGTREGRDLLKDRLKEAIKEAPPGGRTPEDIARYASDAYLDSEISRVVARKERDQPEPPAPVALPPYYPAPREPRDAALGRQRRVIGGWFGAGAKLVRARREADERAQAIIQAAGLDEPALNPDLTDRQIRARKAVISRKVNREVAAEHGLERLSGKGSRLLLTGSQGSGKSRASAEEVAVLDGDVVAWWTVPTIEKAEEQADEYRKKYAHANSLPAMVVRGRGQDDPEQPGKAMCPRHKVVNGAAARGIEVRKKICKVCPLKDQCGYLKQEAQISGMNGGLFLMAREYAFMPTPAPTPDLFIGDESLIPVAVAEPGEFSAERIKEPRNWKAAGLDAAIDAAVVLGKVYDAAAKQPGRILAALREAGISRKQIAEAITYLDKVTETAAAIAITGNMTDTEIKDVLDQIDHDDLPNVIRMLRQIRREWDTGRDGLNTVTVVDGTVTVFGLRTLRISKETPVLLLDGTGSAPLNRVLFGDLTHEHIPVERQAKVTGTKGKSYSRQSITGQQAPTKLNPDGLPLRPAEAERLRQEIADVARRQDGPVFVCATKGAEEVLAPVLPGIARPGHFGALRGINAWEDCRTAVVVGREQVAPQRLEEMARPFTVADPEPFQAFGCYVKQTRGRRMRSGRVEPVAVEVHPDPRCQELLEQIREADIVQGGDRVRPIFNERSFVLLNELVLDVTYDRIMTHKELVMDGNRFERAARQGAIPLSATELHRCFSKLWVSEVAARFDLQRMVNGRFFQIDYTIWEMMVFNSAHYRRLGQPGRATRALIRADAPDPQAALEAVVGPVGWFEMDDPGRAETVAAGDLAPSKFRIGKDGKSYGVADIGASPPEIPELSEDAVTSALPKWDEPDEDETETAEPEPDPAEPVANSVNSRVDPPAADPSEDLDQLQRIIASAGRLADLSARLDYARPPTRWGDLSDASREQAWRARMAALHELPVAAGGRR
jgi:hypothetical protein